MRILDVQGSYRELHTDTGTDTETDSMGNEGSKADKPLEFKGCHREDNKGKPVVVMHFKFANLQKEANWEVIFPNDLDAHLHVRVEGKDYWDAKVYGAVDEKNCKKELVPGKEILVTLAKLDPTEHWPNEKWGA